MANKNNNPYNKAVGRLIDHGCTQASTSVPIAIVGMGWRGPGDAATVDGFSKLLAEGREARVACHTGKWNHDAFYHPDPVRKGTSNVLAGHYFNQDLSRFDARFFHMTEAEAAALDPQQRILLETCYEALENAGITMDEAAGSETSCFIASFGSDYTDLLQKDPDSMPIHQATNSGYSRAFLSNRLSHFFDFRAMSVTIDTACSGGLSALHLACQSIRTGDARQAICGGSSVILHPDQFVSLSAMGFLSPEGRCFAFDDRANGYARGEGVGCILLKRLDDALANGNPVRAVVRMTGSNHDGKTPGISFPSKSAQMTLIRSVYDKAGLDPRDTSYVEAHGTGTQAGDVVESSALAETIASRRSRSNPLTVGALKSNIGHLEAASGIAGLVKCVLMLENEIIFPNRNFLAPNAKIPINDWNLRFPVRLEPWKPHGPHRLSINNFGFGGTNTHAIIESAMDFLAETQMSLARNLASSCCVPPYYVRQVSNRPGRGVTDHSVSMLEATSGGATPRIFIISAFDESSVIRQAHNLATYLQNQLHLSHWPSADLAYTLNSRRSTFCYKAVVSASTAQCLVERLQDNALRVSKSTSAPRIGFVFTGQGAQWARMGLELMDLYPTYSRIIKICADHLKRIGATWDLREELAKPATTSNIAQGKLSQPLCSAVQIALLELLASWNIWPTAVAGHSSGEIAAAYAAGFLNLEDAITSAYHRGLCSHLVATESAVKGAMIAVGLGKNEIQSHLSSLVQGYTTIACENSPCNVTVSGDLAAIDELKVRMDELGIFARKLQVEAAYHSHHMAYVESEYLNSIQNMKTRQGSNVTMFSSVTGKRLRHNELGPSYWVANMVGRVEFAAALRNLCHESGVTILVELGPHSALAGPINQILRADSQLSDRSITYLSALARNTEADRTIVALAASLAERSVAVNTDEINRITGVEQVLTDLPSYSWDKSTSYWAESRISREHRHQPHPRGDLLGRPINSNPQDMRWRSFVRLSEIPWIKDHQIQSTMVYPAAGYITMAVEAIRQVSTAKFIKPGAYKMREISLRRAMLLPDETEGVEIFLTLRPYSQGTRELSDTWYEFFIYSVTAENKWCEHCRGLISVDKPSSSGEGIITPASPRKSIPEQLRSFQQTCTTHSDVDKFYKILRKIGLHFGPTFANVTSACTAPSRCVTSIAVPDTGSGMPASYQYPFVLHPACLESIFHSVLVALVSSGEGSKGLRNAVVPTFIENISISSGMNTQPGVRLESYNVINRTSPRKIEASIKVVDPSQQSSVVIDIDGLVYTSLSDAAEYSAARAVAFNFSWEIDVSMLTSEVMIAICTGSLIVDGETVVKEQRLRQICLQYLESVVSLESEISSTQEDDTVGVLRSLLLQAQDADFQPTVDSSPVIHIGERPFKSTEENLVHLVGEKLGAILSGTQDLRLLLDSYAHLDEFFNDSLEIFAMHQPIGRYFNLLSHKNPHLKVLEIGAGAGSNTKHVLDAIGILANSVPRFAKWDIMHPGRKSFKFQDELAAWEDLIELKENGFDDTLREQCLEFGQYDAILGVYISAQSSSIRATIENIGKLLKPGGFLVLLEPSPSNILSSTVFGAMPSGWLHRTHEQWNNMLLENNFHDIGIFQPTELGHHPQNLLLIAKKALQEHSKCPALLIIDTGLGGESPLVRHLATQLHCLGLSVDVCGLENADPIGKICIVLEDGCPVFYDIEQQRFGAVQRICLHAHGVLWVTWAALLQTPVYNIVTGLARTIRSETHHTAIITLDIEKGSSEQDIETAITSLIRRCFMTELDDEDRIDTEYKLRKGCLMIPRLVPDDDINRNVASCSGELVLEHVSFAQSGRPLRLEVGTPGAWDAMYFADDENLSMHLGEHCVEIEVMAVGLNLLDLMIAKGKISAETVGLECSGVVRTVGSQVEGFSEGDHVLCLHLGTMRTYVRADARFVHKLPHSMTVECGASIPAAYCTAFHSVFHVSGIRAGETVLLHAATGGLGRAIIQLCNMVGVTLFVTVESPEAKDPIMKSFSIPEKHIFFSRDESLYEGIMRMTSNRGVDVIFNTLSGEYLTRAWNCIAPAGRFLELGNHDIINNTRLEMANFSKNVTFTAVNLMSLLQESPEVIAQAWDGSMKILLQGTVKVPEPLIIYPIMEIATALHKMETGHCNGKFIIARQHNDTVKAITPPITQTLLQSDATYVLVGGLGGLGRVIAQWMVSNGAKNLCLISRSGDAKPQAQEAVRTLRSCGAVVELLPCDITDALEVARVAQAIRNELPSVRGVIQCAMTLKDTMFENMTADDFNAVIRPKVHGTLALHQQFSLNLDFFIMLSSISGVIGNVSQAAYAGANTFLDAFANFGTTVGLPATSINLGVIMEVGHVAEQEELRHNMERQGFEGTTPEELMALLRAAIVHAGRNVDKSQIVTGMGSWNANRSLSNFQAPLFSHFRRMAKLVPDGSTEANEKCPPRIRDALEKATDNAEASRIISDALIRKISSLGKVGAETISPSKPFSECGVDSLVAVELRNWIFCEMDYKAAILELMSSQPIQTLATKIARQALRDSIQADTQDVPS